MKFIVVTGGVISGLGKGITASSIGLLLKNRGVSVTAVKIDPYLNIDAGTMSPHEHGECYVLADGGEVDLDLGNYERFLDIDLTANHNLTTGKIYHTVITKERAGDYLGKTVQIVPHVTNEIQDWIKRVSQVDVGLGSPEVCIIEIGGTVGDMETAPFIEAIRQLSCNKEHKFCFVHVSMIVDNGELKTKPTQQSVANLRSYGIFPNILVLRTSDMLPTDIIKKLNMFCHIPEDHIISNTNVPNIYYVPDNFSKQGIDEKIAKLIDLEIGPNTSNYQTILDHFNVHIPQVNIGVVGKYVGSQDAYLSLIRAIEHASFKVGVYPKIDLIDAEVVNVNELSHYNGFIIPGGFGIRGIEGMIRVAGHCRTNKIPLLGICLGLQVMVTESIRSRGLDANSTEWVPDTPHPVVDILPDQTGIKGGTMRLGNYNTQLAKDSKVYELYGESEIVERHRHRYEVNNKYLHLMGDLNIVGKTDVRPKSETSTATYLIEVLEMADHPFFVGCQYHPELKSRYNKPHPLFVGLLEALLNHS